jgi:hypothetical protein
MGAFFSARASVTVVSVAALFTACAQVDTTTMRRDAATMDRNMSRIDAAVPPVGMDGGGPGGGCVPGETRDCYTGPRGTDGVGACRVGTQTCNGSRVWSPACVGERTPAAMETCGNATDDDCNGMADEMCGECTAGMNRNCYTGPMGTLGVGTCRGGTQTCDAARMWPAGCAGEVVPAMEVCGNMQDDNCNGMTDEMCGECTAGDTRPCYGGPAGTSGRGVCRDGTQTCGPGRMWLVACPGEVRPMASEVCGNALDDNCNGMVDEMCGECTPGMTRSCYTGPAGTSGVGICRTGMQTCTPSRAWGACSGEVRPMASETCGNMQDDNCNGMTDEMCGECTSGMTRSCYTGPAGTSGVGACRTGTQTCTASRTWPTTCTGEVRPAASEMCGNMVDDNCNGMTDEMCGECTSGMTRSCYTGPAGTSGVGACRAGTQTCTASRTWPTTCTGEVRPAASEMCGNMVDDNCNGMTDEMCGECTSGMTRSCYTGPAGTSGVGACRAGTQTCTASRTWPTTCTGEVRPAASEMCGNMVDDNCNGMTDEGCVTAPANNNRANARVLTLGASELTVTGTTAGATQDGPTPCVCTSGPNVWFSITLSERTIIYADTAGSSYDTSLMLVDSAGNPIVGWCNDDAPCSTGGFTAGNQSRIFGALSSGTYYIAVGGCGSGAFTLHVQRIPTSFASFVYTSSPLTGTGTTASTTLIGTSRRTPTCGAGLGPSGEDAHYFLTCGGQPQTFSLCQSDGGSFVRRSGTTDYDPIMSLWSAQSGTEVACNDDGLSMGGTNCQGTGGDTANFGSRLSNITVPRGIGAVVIDERRNTSGLRYSMRYVVR